MLIGHIFSDHNFSIQILRKNCVQNKVDTIYFLQNFEEITTENSEKLFRIAEGHNLSEFV